jgi:GTP-binding protein
VSPRRRARPTRGRDTEIPLEGLPVVAIVGRPNVGKSTIFNRVVGERLAVVEDKARTTRDRQYAAAEWNGRRFILVDTGGLEQHPGDPIEEKVQEQARLAIREADVILFVVDAESGETPSDAEAAELLRAASTPVVVAVNKADNPKRELEGAEFHRYGWEETYFISAIHGRGTGDLLDAIVWALPPESEQELDRKRREAEAESWLKEDGWAPVDLEARAAAGADDDADEMPLVRLADGADADDDDEADVESTGDDGVASGGAGPAADDERVLLWDARAAADRDAAARPLRVAIVGRPNVGKSSLLNALLGQERTIVSDIPGTTRDAIDSEFDWSGRRVRLIDTAGLKRRGKIAGGAAADRFSSLRSLKAISRADVAVLVIDAVDGLTAQDAHVAGYVIDEGKGIVLALNKWDLVEKDPATFDAYVDRLRREAPFLHFAPVMSISAKTGQRVGRVLDAAAEIATARRQRVSTGELNRLLADATFRQAPPAVKGHRPKLLYATQAGVEPPTFVIFATDAQAVHFSYQRYLENRLRDVFGFAGTPIRLVFRNRTREEHERRRPRRPARRRTTAAARKTR